MFSAREAAEAVGAELRGPDAAIARVVTDSRQVGPGDLFVALRGERFDGNGFVDGALAAGASAALVSDPAQVRTDGATLLCVPDTRIALGALASWWRARFHVPVAGVTGSSGKTSVKEMLAGILRAHTGDDAVLATQGNLNNDIGVPVMLLRLRAQHRFAVIEMGMNHLGEIRYLTGLARPDVAVINNAGTAHIGELGSRDNIARAKGEIFEGLSDEGVRVVNADDDYAGYWLGLAPDSRVVTFGMEHAADVRAVCETGAAGSVMTLQLPGETVIARLQVPGAHNVRNALAAAAVAHVLGVPGATIATGLGAYGGTSGRMQRRTGTGGATVVDDTYNANPDSMKAALSWLGALPGKRIFVMGDMGELGADSATLHAEVGRFAAAQRIDCLLGLGDAAAGAVRAFGPAGRHFQDVDALVEAVQAECRAGVTVLVKGSRFMRMERVIARIADGAAPVEGH